MKWKTQPYQHQLDVWERSKDLEYFGLFLEQGTGKTITTLITGAHLHQKKKIEAIVVLAPKGVHLNWEEETKQHLPIEDYSFFVWNSTFSKKVQQSLEKTISYPGLKIYSFNIDAVNTDKGRKIIEWIMQKQETLLVLDESSKIKSPKAKRTKALLKLAPKAKYRRILTGTPVTQSPLDVWSQLQFLSPRILAMGSFTVFSNHFALFEEKINMGTGRRFRVVKEYRNLDELKRLIDPHTVRITKKECLDLPDKIYITRRIELNPNQKKMYKEMKDNLLVEIENQEVTAPLLITKMLRLSQITGGYLEKLPIPGNNPKIEAVKEILEELDNTKKIIIWCRFIDEIKGLEKELKKIGKVVTYHGEVKQENRQKAIKSFQEDPRTRFFVANAATGGTGITLTAADTVIYYSNSYSLEDRLQSEDRCHRIGQTNRVTYYDLVANSTIDTHVLAALKQKKGFADTITGDGIKNLL